MTYPRRVTVIATAVLVLLMGTQALLVRRVDQLRAGATLQEVLYIPSPEVVKRLSLGYSGLLADIYWTRAVQYFGGKHHARSTNYQLLLPLLQITTTLDPHLIPAYQFGAIFLAQGGTEGAGLPDEAIQLVEKGIRENPTQWRLYYSLGYIYFLEKHDYAAASKAFYDGSQVPGALPWMKTMAAAMAQHGGETETARFLWTKILESTDDNLIRANAINHLRCLQADEEVTYLDSLVQHYASATGHLPANWMEMVSAGWLRRIPVDPLGHTYKLMPDGHVELQTTEGLPFATKGLPAGARPMLAPGIPG